MRATCSAYLRHPCPEFVCAHLSAQVPTRVRPLTADQLVAAISNTLPRVKQFWADTHTKRSVAASYAYSIVYTRHTFSNTFPSLTLNDQARGTFPRRRHRKTPLSIYSPVSQTDNPPACRSVLALLRQDESNLFGTSDELYPFNRPQSFVQIERIYLIPSQPLS